MWCLNVILSNSQEKYEGHIYEKLNCIYKIYVNFYTKEGVYLIKLWWFKWFKKKTDDL